MGTNNSKSPDPQEIGNEAGDCTPGLTQMDQTSCPQSVDVFGNRIEEQWRETCSGISDPEVKKQLSTDLKRFVQKATAEALLPAIRKFARSWGHMTPTSTSPLPCTSQAPGEDLSQLTTEPLKELFGITEEKVQRGLESSFHQVLCDVVGVDRADRIFGQFTEVIVEHVVTQVNMLLTVLQNFPDILCPELALQMQEGVARTMQAFLQAKLEALRTQKRSTLCCRSNPSQDINTAKAASNVAEELPQKSPGEALSSQCSSFSHLTPQVHGRNSAMSLVPVEIAEEQTSQPSHADNHSMKDAVCSTVNHVKLAVAENNSALPTDNKHGDIPELDGQSLMIACCRTCNYLLEEVLQSIQNWVAKSKKKDTADRRALASSLDLLVSVFNKPQTPEEERPSSTESACSDIWERLEDFFRVARTPQSCVMSEPDFCPIRAYYTDMDECNTVEWSSVQSVQQTMSKIADTIMEEVGSKDPVQDIPAAEASSPQTLQTLLSSGAIRCSSPTLTDRICSVIEGENLQTQEMFLMANQTLSESVSPQTAELEVPGTSRDDPSDLRQMFAEELLKRLLSLPLNLCQSPAHHLTDTLDDASETPSQTLGQTATTETPTESPAEGKEDAKQARKTKSCFRWIRKVFSKNKKKEKEKEKEVPAENPAATKNQASTARTKRFSYMARTFLRGLCCFRLPTDDCDEEDIIFTSRASQST